MLTDTHPDIRKVEIELIRRMSVAERIRSMRSMTAMAIRLSRRAIARVNPGLSPQEVDLRWVEIHYGKKLAAELREYLDCK